MDRAKIWALVPLFLLLVNGGAGCKRAGGAKKGSIAAIESTLGVDRSAIRAIADAPGGTLPGAPAPTGKLPVCLKDRVTPDAIEAQVKLWESQALDVEGGKKESGTSLGLDLSTLPSPQARYLKAQSRWTSIDAAPDATCQDPFCVVGSAYSPPNALAGRIAYGWKLHMGYLLSFKDEMPVSGNVGINFNPPQKLEQFLFRDNEVKAFWKLALSLPDGFRYLQSLNTFHRVPSGFKLPGWSRTTCADAVGTQKQGFIRLSDNCLTLGSDEVREGEKRPAWSGFFYEAVAHEIAHRMDHSFAKEMGDLFSRTDPEWLALNGWKEETVVDSDTGKLENGWKANEELDGFVRSYASTSPAEAWADTVAYLRYSPAEVWAASPKKSAYLQKKAFAGRSYLPDGRLDFYQQKAQTRLSPLLAGIAHYCIVDARPTLAAGQAPTEEAKTLKWSVPLSESMQTCLATELDKIAALQWEALKSEEWEACDDLKGPALARLRQRVYDFLHPELDHWVQNKSSLAPALQAAKTVRGKLADLLDPREAYLRCSRADSPASCYDQALQAAFDSVAEPYKSTLGDLYEQEKHYFISSNGRDAVGVQVTSFFKFLLTGVDRTLADAAHQRFKSCQLLDSPTLETGQVLVAPFSGGAQFIDQTLLQCINTNAQGDIEKAVDASLKRMGVGLTDEDSRSFVKPLVLAPYLEALQKDVLDAAAAEQALRDARKSGVVDVLVSEVLTDASWANQVSTLAQGIEMCQPVAQKAFDDYFERVSAGEKLPVRFEAIENVRTQWGREACQKAVGNSKISDGIKTRQTQLWSEAMKELEALLLTKADAAILQCRRTSPGPSVFNKKRRRDCLVQGFPSLESDSIEEWLKTPKGQLLSNRRADAQKYLELRRPSLLVLLGPKLG